MYVVCTEFTACVTESLVYAVCTEFTACVTEFGVRCVH
jgi:hypothetical protein